MDQFREMIVRGTPDFPFAIYNMHRFQLNTICTPSHWHPEQEILYVTQGRIELLMEKSSHQLHAGDMAFVPPNTLHSIRNLCKTTQYFALVFSYDLVTMPETHFFQKNIVVPLRSVQLSFPAVISSDHPVHNDLIPILDSICFAQPNLNQYRLCILQNMFQLFCALEHTLIPPRDTFHRRDNESVKLCLEYLNDHFGERITLEQLATKLHIHPNYLCSLFKEHTGQTVFQYLHRIRMEYAAKLLRKQNLTVNEIAAACGFESNSFFSRKFKAFMGIPPKKYRILSQTSTENHSENSF